MRAYATVWTRRRGDGALLLPSLSGAPASPDHELTAERLEWRASYHHLLTLVALAPSLSVDIRETIECAQCLAIATNAAPGVSGEKRCQFMYLR